MAEVKAMSPEEEIAELKRKLENAEKKNKKLEKAAEEIEALRADAEAAAQREAAKVERSMKRILDAQPKVKIRLFKDDNKYVDDVFVQINGVSYQIKRGETVEVPESVAAVIANMETQDANAAERLSQLSASAAIKELM